jgi:type VI secretion system protein
MPSGPSLYDMLLGHIGGEPFHAYDDKTLEIMSVQQNIRRILNTRAGALKHLPDYGLPDLTNIYKALPASAHLLKQQMETTLLAYEPRIRAIDVDYIDNADPGVLVSYEMTCHLKKAGLVERILSRRDVCESSGCNWRSRTSDHLTRTLVRACIHPNGRTPIHHPCNQNANTTQATTPPTTAIPSLASVPAG